MSPVSFSESLFNPSHGSWYGYDRSLRCEESAYNFPPFDLGGVP